MENIGALLIETPNINSFASEQNPNLRATGIKFAVERQDGAITTWHTCFDAPAEQILKDIMPKKNWEQGRIFTAYIEFADSSGKYFKQNLDLKPLQHVLNNGL
jgi:hypothetical protein